MLTRTKGVLAISAMLAVGPCCAKATPDSIITAEKAATFNDFPNATQLSLKVPPRGEGVRFDV